MPRLAAARTILVCSVAVISGRQRSDASPKLIPWALASLKVSAAFRVRLWRRPRLGYRLELGLMLAPYLAGLALLIVVPVLLVAVVAFADYDALRPPRWIGLGNFREMLRDADFWNGLRASLVYVALAVPLRVVGALTLALLLHQRGRGIGLFRAAAYIPTIVPDVAYALLWLYIFNPVWGPLNFLLVFFTGPSDPAKVAVGHAVPTGWLLHPLAAQVAIVIMLSWTIGEGFVLLMAALQDIPRELYESADMDGAGTWRRFRLITLPWLAPILLYLAFRDTVLSFQYNFEAAVIVTQGGPYYATSYLPYWIYLNAVDYQRFGYAAAMTLVMVVVSAVIILLQFGLVRRWRAAFYE